MEHQLSQQCFYKGQSISPENLNTLQEYNDHTNSHLVASLFGQGIIHGFEVSKVSEFCIKISEGSGFDHLGKNLILPKEEQLDLSYININEMKILYLGIKYTVIGSEPVQDVIGNIINTKLTPSVEFVLNEELDKDSIEIASISMNSSGILDIRQDISYITTYQNFNQKIIDITYPINSYYTQYPRITIENDQEIYHGFSYEESPSYLFGGAWELQFSSKNVFFRTEGSLANVERHEDGTQSDAIRNIYGEIGYRDQMGGLAGLNPLSALFKGIGREISIPKRYQTSGLGPDRVSFDASRVVPTAAENRTLNMLMRIWKRIA
ncbi:MAG: hypothetical protein ACRCVW_00135 [Brevinema sp.]